MAINMASPACTLEVDGRVTLVGCGAVTCACGYHEHFDTHALQADGHLAHLRAHAQDFADLGIDIEDFIKRGSGHRE